MIILEGMDNSGKSTLATKFGLEVVHPGPAPKSYGEEQGFLDLQLRDARLPIVMDRVTCISSQVYKGQLFDTRYMDYLRRMVETPHCIIVYCRPPDRVVLNMDLHEVKPYDTAEHLAKIKVNASSFLRAYDKIMQLVPHMLYDYTCPDDNIIQQAVDAQFIIGEWKKCKKFMTMPKHG
jgi:hypothetical protein